MLYSKANLVVGQVASKDPFDRALCGVRFEADGATVAGNGKVLVAVEAVDERKVSYPNVGEHATPGNNGVVLTPEHVSEALSNIPKDKRMVLQHCVMTRGQGDVSMVELTSINAEGRTRRVADRPKPDRYPEWKEVIKKVHSTGDGSKPVKVCVNRSDLIELLKTIEAACPDRGKDCPVFLEIGNGIVARSQNRDTGQHAIGAINSYNTRGQWVGDTNWTRGVLEKIEKNFKEEKPSKTLINKGKKRLKRKLK